MISSGTHPAFEIQLNNILQEVLADFGVAGAPVQVKLSPNIWEIMACIPDHSILWGTKGFFDRSKLYRNDVSRATLEHEVAHFLLEEPYLVNEPAQQWCERSIEIYEPDKMSDKLKAKARNLENAADDAVKHPLDFGLALMNEEILFEDQEFPPEKAKEGWVSKALYTPLETGTHPEDYDRSRHLIENAYNMGMKAELQKWGFHANHPPTTRDYDAIIARMQVAAIDRIAEYCQEIGYQPQKWNPLVATQRSEAVKNGVSLF